jgi:hypothetical protein
MEIKKIISEQPKCRTCGKLMTIWDPYAKIHEHIECASERMSTNLINVIKKQFDNLTK